MIMKENAGKVNLKHKKFESETRNMPKQPGQY
jgi:hypothetical protein